MFCALIAVVLTSITNAAGVATALQDRIPDAHFSIRALVTYVSRFGERTVAVEDDSGAVILLLGQDTSAVPTPAVGDHVELTGATLTTFPKILVACCRSGKTIGHAKPSAPAAVTSGDFLSGACDNRYIRLQGVIAEVFSDEISQGWQYLVLNQNGDSIYAAFPKSNADDQRIALGAEVVVTGICDPSNLGLRRLLGRILVACSADDVTVLRPPPADPFDAPRLDDSSAATPQEVVARGRVKASGHVLAARENNSIILRDDNGDIVNVELSERPVPLAGEYVDVVGQTETDLYRVNLSHAKWRPSAAKPFSLPNNAQAVTSSDLFWNKRRQRELQVIYHGRLVRLRGTVEHVATFENGGSLLHLASENEILKVEIPPTNMPPEGLLPGAQVEFTGICVMDTENWHQGGTFPHIRSVSVVVRQADDIRILSQPPWWTPARFLSALGLLLLALIGLFAWNRVLQALITRKSRQLLREQAAKIESELRIDERTRLAAELHDNLAQNLTAITYQVSAALRARLREPEASQRHLTTASRMLDSCRTELRRCLWDLRSDALDAKDFNEAIRLSVTPVLGNATLAVRFNVPRCHIKDSTAQTVLSILRELVSNAIRHGHAACIRIAGKLDGETLRLSVRDDGCGFDLRTRATSSDGHFGLDGISERVGRQAGNMKIESAVGHGTRIQIAIPIHHQDTEHPTTP